MKTYHNRSGSVLSGCAVVLAASSHSAFGFGGNNGTVCPTPVGPDVIVGDLIDVGNYASLNGIEAFALGTTSCNIGNQNIQWQASNNNHPVIGQNIYKLKDGRFEMIGMSWLKHGFTALTQNICGCGCSGQGGSVLGVGCSDPYGSGLNGSQSSLGPRWQVNANTGVFTYPPANPTWSGSTARRVQVKIADLEPSSATVLYFGEGQYVTKDDATWGNQDNNSSYRRMSMSGSGTAWNGGWIDGTVREKPAIRAWKVQDPTVVETDFNITQEGKFILAAKATDLGNGNWHYEYALHNLNSDASGQSFTVPIPAGAKISNIGFHDVDYHSGDGVPLPDGPDPDTAPDWRNYDGTDWTVTELSASVSWATETFAANSNANALRWGTLYNFRFDANRPPRTGDITIGLFKTAGEAIGSTLVPGEDCNANNVADNIDITSGTSSDVNANGVPDECDLPACLGDIAPAGGNGVIDVDDLLVVINNWGACKSIPECPGDVAPKGSPNGAVDADDLILVIQLWGKCN